MNYYRISDEDFWDKVNADYGQGGGVYILKYLDGDKPIPIPRMLGVDKDGILYIGSSTSFLDRVIELKKSIAPKYNSSGHDAGKNYKASQGIQDKFPYENLVVRLIGSETPKELESKLLKSYRDGFGEVPPLNSLG